MRLNEAEAAAAAGRIADAVALLTDAVAERPDHVNALRMLAGLYRKLGDRTGALGCYRSILNLTPENYTAQLDVATECSALGLYEEARPLYESILRDRPDDLGVRRSLASLARRLGDREAALSQFQCLADLMPGDVSVRLDIAADLAALDRVGDAIAQYHAVLEADPNNVSALKQLGLLERKRHDRSASLASFRMAVELAPGDVNARMELAAELVAQGSADEGRGHYEQILAEMPEYAPAHRALGLLARSQGDRAAAMSHFEAALRCSGENAGLQVDIATELAAFGRLSEAVSRFETAMTLDPEHVGARRGLAGVFRRFGDRTAALAQFELALAMRPEDPGLLLDCAHELAALQRPAEALPLVRAALSLQPGFVAALMLEGRLHRSLGNPALALASFEAASSAAPGEVAPLLDASQAAEALGDAGRAVAALESALALDRGDPAVLARCAALARKSGDIGSALDYAKRAVAAALDRGMCHLPGLDVLQSLGAPAAVDDVFDRAFARWGREPSLVLRLGEHRLRQGRVREACVLAEELRATDGQRFESQSLGVRASVACGDFGRAREQLQRVFAAPDGDARAHLLAAQLAEAEWDAAAALAAAQRALALDADCLAAHKDAARYALLLLDTDRAETHLNEVLRLMPPHTKRRGYSDKALLGLTRTLLVDYIVNPSALSRLCAIPESDIRSLLELIRHEPGYTAAAITLLVRLRRAGLLSAGGGADRSGQSDQSSIPRRIVQYWDAADAPPDVSELVASWRKAHPAWEHRLFSDASALTFLQQNFPQSVVRAYRAAGHASQKADLFRLAYLVKHGGYYADADDLCLAPIPTFVPAATEIVLAQEYWGSVGNNFLGAVARHPILESALSQCVETLLEDSLDNIWLATGPGLVTRALAAWIARTEEDFSAALEGLLVLDRHQTADRFGALQPLAYKSTGQHWTATASRRLSAAELREPVEGRIPR